MERARIVLRKTKFGMRATPVFPDEFNRMMKAGRLKTREGLYVEIDASEQDEVVESTPPEPEQEYETRDMVAKRPQRQYRRKR